MTSARRPTMKIVTTILYKITITTDHLKIGMSLLKILNFWQICLLDRTAQRNSHRITRYELNREHNLIDDHMNHTEMSWRSLESQPLQFDHLACSPTNYSFWLHGPENRTDVTQKALQLLWSQHPKFGQTFKLELEWGYPSFVSCQVEMQHSSHEAHVLNQNTTSKFRNSYGSFMQRD